MDKTGHWVFGTDQTEIEPDSIWAVNPFSFIHGYIAWGDGDVLGEKMAPISQPMPELDVAPPGAKKGWETQVGLSIKCMNGDDKNMEARYTSTSVGGKRAIQTLGVAIAQQIDKDPSKPVAVITLGKEFYTHKSYGRIYTPIFNIIDWVSMDADNSAPVLELDEEVEDAPVAPIRRRRSAV